MTDKIEFPSLQSLVDSNELSKDGLAWMSQALDPFHDTNRRAVGYPDLTNGSSLVQVVTLTKTFTILSPLDFHVFSLPFLTQLNLWQYQTQSPSVVLASAPTVPYGSNPCGLWNVVQVLPGAPTFPAKNAGGAYTTVNILDNYSFDFSPYLVGNSRLVATGCEVINTGPELLKSGSLTTYRGPQALVDSQVAFQTDVDVQRDLNVIRVSMPPATAADALLIHGSQMWDAYEGAYMVGSLATVNNPAQRRDYKDPLIESAPGETGPGICLMTRASELFPSELSTTQYTPWNTSGAFVTGTSVGTILTVVVKAYIECFPLPSDQAFLTLTSPASAYDPEALELYAKTSYVLKPATLRSNNPGGEWFKIVKGVVAAVAPRVGQVKDVIRGGTATAQQVKSMIASSKQARNGAREARNYGAAQKGNTVSAAKAKSR
jgi:hypothetical protein